MFITIVQHCTDFLCDSNLSEIPRSTRLLQNIKTFEKEKKRTNSPHRLVSLPPSVRYSTAFPSCSIFFCEVLFGEISGIPASFLSHFIALFIPSSSHFLLFFFFSTYLFFCAFLELILLAFRYISISRRRNTGITTFVCPTNHYAKV